ncbi:MAG TPA: HlyD family secretion protein [Phycisphaerae bacterium]|nr:HlyD family secretion protein [Phycisphaerae bacterium]
MVPRSRRPLTMVWVVILLIVIAAATAAFMLLAGDKQSTNDAYLEGRAIRISPRVAGPVIALHVDDNVYVKAGDVLLEIDPADYQAKVDQASAAVATAESAIEQTKAAVLRAEAAVGEAVASVRAADTEAKRRASDYRRYSAMGTDGVSEQQLETAKAAMDTASDQHEAVIKKQAAAEAELNVARVNVHAAESQLAAAKAQLHLAELQLQYTKVVAPISGSVANRNVEMGAFVSTGQPLLAIVPDERWVVANFKEVQLRRMRPGQPAVVRVDAYPDLRLRGHVESLQAGTGSRFQLLPPENATGNWVKVVQRLPVKIVFNAGQPGLAKLAQGMSVTVTVDTGRRISVLTSPDEETPTDSEEQ